MLVIHIVAQIIEHHVTVEDRVAVSKTFLCKAVVVIPWTHLLYHGFNVAIGRKHSHTLVVCEHFTYILRRESEHLVQLRLRRCIPADIEAAGQVIQGHRTHPCQENTLEIALEFLEKVTIEAVGMGYCMIDLLSEFV